MKKSNTSDEDDRVHTQVEEKSYNQVTLDEIIERGKIPTGSIAVFKGGKQAVLKKDAKGTSVMHNNYMLFDHPIKNIEDSIGVTGPYITNRIGNDIPYLEHFLIPAEKPALAFAG